MADGTHGLGHQPGEGFRILFVTSDQFPPFRPAAKAIFSEGLADAGVELGDLDEAALVCGAGVHVTNLPWGIDGASGGD